MNRARVAETLGHELGTSYIVVPSPDHPELLSGPDVLIGGSGNLTAVFRVARTVSSRIVFARVVAARLALPPATRFVAMVDTNATPPRSLIDQGFDDVLGETEITALVRLCRSARQSAPHLADLKSVQRRHSTFYSTVLQVATLRRKHELQSMSSHEVLSELERREQSRFPHPAVQGESVEAAPSRRTGRQLHRVDVQQTVVAALPRDVRAPVGRRLLPFWAETFSTDFVLDRGVPYSQAELLPRVLLVETWPHHRFDPSKPTRAAAFSGWLMALATTAADVEALVDRSQEITRRRLRGLP